VQPLGETPLIECITGMGGDDTDIRSRTVRVASNCELGAIRKVG
jgi:hypothetical protein